jgi:hypothetical protein
MSEEEIQDAPATSSVEDIMEEVVAGAATHSAATEIFMDNFVFYDKSLSAWLDEMALEIPKELTPEDLRSLYIELAYKIQKASNFYSIASSIHGGLIDGGEIKKSDLVNSIINKYSKEIKKRPAANIIERMADSYMNGTIHTKIAARIVKDFWKERRDTLIELRKCLEQIAIGFHTEMKYHQ